MSSLVVNPLLAAVGVVAGCALLTRGLHLDGLADTADGLGAYADRARSLEIMRRPDIGPFGVITLVLVLLAQVAAASAVLERAWLPATVGIVAAIAAGRVAVTLGCQRGIPPARPEGLGAMVAGTVPGLVGAVWAIAVAALAIVAVPGRPWQGPLAVALGIGVALLLRRHAVRRLGGVTGDVLGALTETTVTATFIVISI
jgi:adenosylcobinamide-GDP ribazoletransferase